ncbi:MAG: methionine-rich copper-binding protein CopC [Glaciecola sp.]
MQEHRTAAPKCLVLTYPVHATPLEFPLMPVWTPTTSPRLRAVVAIVLLALVALLAVPMASQAHEGHGVIRSVPEERTIVGEAPSEVLVEFEGILVEGQVDVRVYTNRGAQIESGEADLEGGIVRVPVDETVGDGIYQIIYDVNTEAPSGGFHSFKGTIRYTVRGGACAGRITNVGAFTSVKAPDFASPPNTMTLAVVDKNFQQVIYASNGRELQRSTDSGCSWATILDLGAADAAGAAADALIVEIATAREVPGAAAVLVLDPADDGANVAQPIVHFTQGANLPLVAGGVGLEPIRFDPSHPLGCRAPQPCHFAFSDAAPGGSAPTLYLLTKPAFELGVARLFRSSDTGQNFAPTASFVSEMDLLSGGGVAVEASALAPDVQQPDTVYVSTGRSVHVSFNRGDTFAEAYRLDSTEGQVITHLSSGSNFDADGIARRDLLAVIATDDPTAAPAAIARLQAIGTTLVRGADLDVSPMNGAYVASLARGAKAGQFLVLPARSDQVRPGVFEYEASIDGLLDLDTEKLSPWLNAQATSPICTRWFGHDRDRMYFVDADDGHGHVHSAGDFCTQPDPGFADGNSVDIIKFPPTVAVDVGGSAVLAAATDRLMLAPGVPQQVGYRLSRAAEDVPVDIAFLFDTSGSMRDNVEAVRAAFAEIVRDIEGRDISANFGLAEFNDLTVRYRRLADIQPIGDAFSRALAEMQISAGDKEPHLTALHQLATGEGLQNPSAGAPVPVGKQMNWRPNAVRIVIMASDEKFFDDPDGPTFAKTVAALNADEIHHVGLHIREELGGDSSNSTGVDNPAASDALLAQMKRLSEATDTFAAAPIDCDGDGVNDIQRGQPLVCTFSNTVSATNPAPESGALAQAVVDLVAQVNQGRPFRLQADMPSGFTAKVRAAGLGGNLSDTVTLDVTLPQFPLWSVSYSCTDAVLGQVAEVPVRALMADASVARLTTAVICGTLVDDPVIPVVAITIAAGAAVVPPPPPPPPAVPANAPAPTAASANAFAQSAATSPAVGAAAAPQFETQVQEAQIRDEDDAQFQYAARRESNDSPQTTLILGFVMAAGVGVAKSRQQAGQRQRASVRVRR